MKQWRVSPWICNPAPIFNEAATHSRSNALGLLASTIRFIWQCGYFGTGWRTIITELPESQYPNQVRADDGTARLPLSSACTNLNIRLPLLRRMPTFASALGIVILNVNSSLTAWALSAGICISISAKNQSDVWGESGDYGAPEFGDDPLSQQTRP